MWLALAFISAALLGLYDACKKKSLRGNDVIAVLFLNTLFSSLIFLPFILLSATTDMLNGTIFHVGGGGWEIHKYILLKSCIVLSVDFRVFRFEAFAFDPCRTYQCHPPRDDAGGRIVDLR